MAGRWQLRKRKVYAEACLIRDALRKRLGGKCNRCGATENLEFHHLRGRDWEARKQNLRHRMRLYWRDFLRGVLELVCSACHTRGGSVSGYWQRAREKSRGVRRNRRSGRKGRQ